MSKGRYSRKEIDEFLTRLTDADIGRLLLWAKRFEKRCGVSPDDLLQKANVRFLQKSAAREFEMFSVLCGMIKSVADAEKRKRDRRPPVIVDTEHLDQVLAHRSATTTASPEDELIAREQEQEFERAKDEFLATFPNPQHVRLVVEAQLDGITKPREIVNETGLTPNQVDAARKRVKRATLRIVG